MDVITRREVLAAAALAAGSMAAAAPNDAELPSFRLALEQTQGRVLPAGSAKEASIRELPVSTGLAGVSMRLKPGGLRELHWHANAAEWAYVIRGRCRTTVIGPDSTTETNDFGPGDVWYFPRGHGHSIQALGSEECHFILVFDNGAFSEFGTFSSTDWLGHIPQEVLAKSLGVSRAEAAQFPAKELYIVQGKTPPDRPPPNHGRGLRPAPSTHRFPLMAQPPVLALPIGTEWRVTVREFPISTTMCGLVLDLKAGATREPHWHPNANEWQYYLSGKARMTVFGSGGRARTEEFSAGDVGYVPQGYGHYLECADEGPCRVLVVFDRGEYQEISLSTWLAANHTQLDADNFQISLDLAKKLPDKRLFLVPGS